MMSIFKMLKVENRKLKHKHIGLLMLCMLSIEMIWLTYNFHDVEKNWSGMEYSAMLYTLPLMIIIFFPFAIAIMASRLCDIEHKGNNFKLLRTLEPVNKIYHSKLFKGLQYILLITIPQILIFFILGRIYDFKESIPLSHILFFFLEVFVISTCVFIIQLFLSLFIENQMIAFIVGLIGSFSGLFGLFVPQISSYTIWGYYSILSPISFHWSKDTRESFVYLTPCNFKLLFVFIAIAFILYFVGKYFFNRKES